MSGFTTTIATGIAHTLADAAVGVYAPDGLYPPDATAITHKALPPAPDRVLAITVYPLTTSLDGTSEVGIQVRCRGTRNPRDVDDLTDHVITALHGLTNVHLDGAVLALVHLTSSAPLGVDANGRWEATANFRAVTTR